MAEGEKRGLIDRTLDWILSRERPDPYVQFRKDMQEAGRGVLGNPTTNEARALSRRMEERAKEEMGGMIGIKSQEQLMSEKIRALIANYGPEALMALDVRDQRGLVLPTKGDAAMGYPASFMPNQQGQPAGFRHYNPLGVPQTYESPAVLNSRGPGKATVPKGLADDD